MINSLKPIIAYVSLPEYELAKKLATILVENRLVACAKIINNLESFYIWEDKLNIDYIDALKIREKLNKKKAEIKEHELITSSSKDILKDKFLAEAKKRLMSDLFS